MYEEVRIVNLYIKDSLKIDIDNMVDQLALSDRQLDIFYRYYVKKQNVGFIADTLGVCEAVVNKELKKVRNKIMKFLTTKSE